MSKTTYDPPFVSISPFGCGCFPSQVQHRFRGLRHDQGTGRVPIRSSASSFLMCQVLKFRNPPHARPVRRVHRSADKHGHIRRTFYKEGNPARLIDGLNGTQVPILRGLILTAGDDKDPLVFEGHGEEGAVRGGRLLCLLI